MAPVKMNLLDFYVVKKRNLAFQLDPKSRSYQGQVRIELQLKEVETPDKGHVSLLQQRIESLSAQNANRLLLEASVLAKQV